MPRWNMFMWESSMLLAYQLCPNESINLMRSQPKSSYTFICSNWQGDSKIYTEMQRIWSSQNDFEEKILEDLHYLISRFTLELQ